MEAHVQKVQDFVQKHQKNLIIGGIAATTATALLYFLLRGGSKKDVKQLQEDVISVSTQPQQISQPVRAGNVEEEQEEHVKRAHHHAQSSGFSQNDQISESNTQQFSQTFPQQVKKTREEILKDIVEKIEVKYIGQTQTLDLSTISAVLEHSIDIAEEGYINLTIQNRKQRRAVMRSNAQDYEELIMQYNEQVEQVLIKAQEDMLEALSIEKEEFEESVLILMERGLYQQMYMLQAAIRQKIKEKIPASREVSMEKTKEVIQYQVKVLKENPDFFKNIITKLQSNTETANMIPMVLNTMLQDLIYEQFNIEEEDQMKNMMGHQILNDPEVHDLLMEIEDAMISLMGSMGMGGGQGMQGPMM